MEIIEAEIYPNVGKYTAKSSRIKHQLDEDRLGEQMTMLGKDDGSFTENQKKLKKKGPFMDNKQSVRQAVSAPAKA